MCETLSAGMEEKTSKKLRCTWEVASSDPNPNAHSAEAMVQQLLASIHPVPGCGFLTERTNTLNHSHAAIPPQAW